MKNLLTVDDVSNDQKQDFHVWSVINGKIDEFKRKSNLNTFNYLFGKDGERLLKHYRKDCDLMWDKFKTYLTQDQINTILINIVHNDELYIQ